ncbi:hypothetical protein MICABA_02647 [Microbacterium sp. T2.11-28]|nr:hypothetical protein MICABA_02647 [Microbacterium sp. T2.11-28]
MAMAVWRSTIPASSMTIRSVGRILNCVGPGYGTPVSGSGSPASRRRQFSAPASSRPHRQPWSCRRACRLDVVAPSSRLATPAAFRVGATTIIRRPSARSAAFVNRSTDVFPAPAGPITATRRSVPAIAAAASTCVASTLLPWPTTDRSAKKIVRESHGAPRHVRRRYCSSRHVFSVTVAVAIRALMCGGRWGSAASRSTVQSSARSATASMSGWRRSRVATTPEDATARVAPARTSSMLNRPPHDVERASASTTAFCASRSRSRQSRSVAIRAIGDRATSTRSSRAAISARTSSSQSDSEIAMGFPGRLVAHARRSI